MISLYIKYNITITIIYLVITFLYYKIFNENNPKYTKLARIFLVFNIFFHGSYILYFGITQQRIPLISVFEAMTLLAFILSCVYLSVEIITKENSLGIFTFPIILFFQIISIFSINNPAEAKEIFRSPLFAIHAVNALTGYACFIFSMNLSIMYLNLFHDIKIKKFKKMYDRLPPLKTLDKMNITSQIIGFIFLTIGIIIGTIWVHKLDLHFSFFDPKIFFAYLLWLIYFINISLKVLIKWSGKKICYLSILGFTVMLTLFLFVNLILPTFHSFK